MKRRFNIFTVLAICLSLAIIAALAVGCSDKKSNTAPTPNGNETEFSLDKISCSMIVGDTAVLVASNYDEKNVTVIWTSSDNGVATVEGGVVNATGAGEAEITATAGEKTAVCKITVGFGNFQPTFSLKHIGNELNLTKANSYTLEGSVSFNGKNYPCESLSVEIDNENIADYEDGKLVPKATGSTVVTVRGEWKNFDTSLMRVSFTLNVIKDVEMYAVTEIDGEERRIDVVDLYVVDEWQGVRYADSAIIKLKVYEDGELKSGTLECKTKERLFVFDKTSGKITPRKKSVGSSYINASYTDSEGNVYNKKIPVNVTCPTVEYEDEFVWDGENFSVTDVFGANAQIYSVKQGGEDVEFEPDKITGKLKFAGKDTEPIEVQTTKGGFLFTNIFGYDAALTAENIVSELTLNGKNEKYYVLNSDMGSAAAPVSFVNQTESSETVSFAGTFDGRGHTLYAKTGRHGIFGGIGLGAVIKNTKFVITFDKSAGKACGLAGNGDVYGSRLYRADSQLENLYIETTNFSENTFAISVIRMMGMKLKDVFVDLGNVSIDDFDGRNNVAALFNVDYSWNNIMVNDRVDLGEMQNVRVVSGKVMPMGNGYAWETSGPYSAVKGFDGWEKYGGYSWYANFAKNDVSLFGSVNHSGALGSVPYSRITATETTNHKDWFKWISVNYITDFVGEKCITVYYGGADIADGGIYRYDTVDDLKADGIMSVGTWNVK